MAIGTSKVGALGGLVPGGTETFNTSGTFCVPPGVKKISVTGAGGTGNPGNPGNTGNPGTAGGGGAGGGGGGGGVNCGAGTLGQPAAKWPGATNAILQFSPAPIPSNNMRICHFCGPTGDIPLRIAASKAGVAPPRNPTVFRFNPNTTGSSGATGSTGPGGSAGSAGNPGNSGQSSSAFCYTFPGGAGGNAGAAGNAGTGGTGGTGGGGGNGGPGPLPTIVPVPSGLNAPQFAPLPSGNGGAGGNSGGNGGPGANPQRSNQNFLYRAGGGGGGGAGVNTSGSPYGPVPPGPQLPGINGAFTNSAPGIGGLGCNPKATGPGTWGFGGTGLAPEGINVCIVFTPVQPNNAKIYGPSQGYAQYTGMGGVTDVHPTTTNPGFNQGAAIGPQVGSGVPNGSWWRAGGGGGGGGTGRYCGPCSTNRYGSAGGGGGGGRGNAGNAGGAGGAGGCGASATPVAHNCVPVTPGSSYPITVASGGSVVISWNPQ